MFTLPTLVTWLRIALIPLFVVVFYWPHPWAHPAAAIVFSLAGITDWLDGYLARKLDMTTAFGAFLDPVADKLMVTTALVLIVQDAAVHRAPWLSISVAVGAAVIIGREITISALREWMAELGARGRVAVSKVGKFKTIFQIIALILMLFEYPLLGLPSYPIGLACFFLAATLTLWSMYVYLHSALPVLRGDVDPTRPLSQVSPAANSNDDQAA